MNLKKQKTTYIVLLILGIIVLFGGTIVVNFCGFKDLTCLSSGFGGGWIGISAVKLYQIKKSPKKIEQQQIEMSDERNIAIRGIAAYCTFIMTLIVLTVMVVIFMLLNYTVPFIITAFAVLVHIMGLLIFTIYCRSKY